MDRHVPASGRNGAVIYNPFDDHHPWSSEGLVERAAETWTRPLTEVGWRRVWGAFDGERIIGSISFAGGSLPSRLHRALLAMGLEEAYRGQGLGARLLETAVTWAQAQPSLDWIDLGVFANNAPARALYARFGFEETGIKRDLFRIWGQHIDDVDMVLNIAAASD